MVAKSKSAPKKGAVSRVLGFVSLQELNLLTWSILNVTYLIILFYFWNMHMHTHTHTPPHTCVHTYTLASLPATDQGHSPVYCSQQMNTLNIIISVLNPQRWCFQRLVNLCATWDKYKELCWGKKKKASVSVNWLYAVYQLAPSR